MYDTVIVFDRVRENVPRMPRAAFSQVVNRSMSEVLTRSLITGLSTVFLVGVLFLFGGDTLKDFAFAMMVGVASGGYSSIFIASPVLTEWKEREPAYRSRRAQIAEAMGYVPTFPEDNVVARVDEAAAGVTRRGDPEEALTGAAAVAPPRPPASPQTSQPAGLPPEQPLGAPQPPAPAGPPPTADGADGAGAAPDPGLPEDHPDRPSRAERQRRRQQRRGRRKHGRNR
jgi:SecD/SecF fusion protein